MATIEDFIKEEVNNYIREVILRSVYQARTSNIHKEELTFNRYSLELLFSEGLVIIYDDVFSEDEPLSLQLEDFLKAIETSSPN